MTKSYRAGLQLSLHDAPNPLDPIGATDWGRTRASAFVDVDVEMTDQTVTRPVDITLLARYYERFADHAVAVARETVYAVTGREPDDIPI
ncbi:MAG: hypothetical protein NVSMB16_14470 [Acidimicrobiales bacterium]